MYVAIGLMHSYVRTHAKSVEEEECAARSIDRPPMDEISGSVDGCEAFGWAHVHARKRATPDSAARGWLAQHGPRKLAGTAGVGRLGGRSSVRRVVVGSPTLADAATENQRRARASGEGQVADADSGPRDRSIGGID